MFDKIKRALGVSEPARASAPLKMPAHYATVPVNRGRPSAEIAPLLPSMGFLDRSGQRARHGDMTGGHVQAAMPLRTADQDVRSAWGAVSGNVRHLINNSGWLSGALDQFTGYAVGSGLTPSITPEHLLIGMTPSYAKSWAREVEMLFDDWANDPLSADDRGQHTFGQLQAAAMRGWFATGDVMAAITYREGRPGAGYKTGVMAVDPVRVMTPPNYASPQTSNLYQGIEVDARGVPIAYWLRPMPGENATGVRIPRFLENGRLSFVHSFIGEPGQIRGISPMASVVEALAQTVSLQDAVLMAAHASASIVGTVTSDLPTESVMKSLGSDGANPMHALMASRAQWHEGLAEQKAGVTLGSNGKVFHLSTGERFELHAGKTHYQNYPDHLKALLREISRSAGLPYEMMSLDRSSATYSSGRMGLLDFWSLVELRRSALLEPMCNLALQSFVEEAIDRRYLTYPGGVKAFRAQKSLALKCRWFGPAKPSVDELKSVNAAIKRLQFGLSSLADETASNGSDWEHVLRQKSHEQKTLDKLGLMLPWPPTPLPVPTK